MTCAGTKLDPNLVWFLLHAVANAFVCAHAWADTVHVFTAPLQSFAASENLGHAIVMATHVFHVLHVTPCRPCIDWG